MCLCLSLFLPRASDSAVRFSWILNYAFARTKIDDGAPPRSDFWIPLFSPVFCARAVARDCQLLASRTRTRAPAGATVARLGPGPRCFQDAAVARSRASPARTSRKKLPAATGAPGRFIPRSPRSARDLESRETTSRLPSTVHYMLCTLCLLSLSLSLSLSLPVEDYFIIRAGLAAVMVCILNISKIAFLGNSAYNGNTWNIIPG